MLDINLKPALLLSSNTTLKECIRQMNLQNTPCVFIQNRHGQLTGMFSDRELLKKHKYLTLMKNQNRPISIVMNKKFHYITIQQIKMAPKFILENDIQYLPVVEGRPLNKRILVGLITPKLLLKQFLHTAPNKLTTLTPKTTNKNPIHMGVLSPNGQIFKVAHQYSKIIKKFDVERMWFSQLQSPEKLKLACRKFNCITIDMDHAKDKNWMSLLKYFNQNRRVKVVSLIYTPELQSPQELKLFQKLKVSGYFHIYQKPVDLIQLYENVVNKIK